MSGWRYDPDRDSHIRRLRKKLADAGCPDGVETVHGFGYKLGSCTL